MGQYLIKVPALTQTVEDSRGETEELSVQLEKFHFRFHLWCYISFTTFSLLLF